MEQTTNQIERRLIAGKFNGSKTEAEKRKRRRDVLVSPSQPA